MYKNMIFVIKDIFEKKVIVIVVFPCSVLFAKTHETWNNRFCFQWVSVQKKIWMKKTMF